MNLPEKLRHVSVTLGMIGLALSETAWTAARLENFNSPDRLHDDLYTVILWDGPQWQNHLDTDWHLGGDSGQVNRKAMESAFAADRVLLEAIAKEMAIAYRGEIIHLSEGTHDFAIQMKEPEVRAMARDPRIKTISANVKMHLSPLKISR